VGKLMFATTVAEAADQLQGGPRAMDPARDMGAIAQLISDAFAHELDERGRAALREMRWMSRMSPLVWWWSQADPAFSETFNGFVWEVAKGQIVGNVSLNRAPGSRQWWIICNVVVQDEYRRRSIGRQLTETAMVEARTLGATGVVLQVYEDNPPALHLYLDLGFREVAGETSLRLVTPQPPAHQDATGYGIRPWRPSDGQAVYELARRVRPLEQQWIAPVRASQYPRDGWARLGEQIRDWLAGRRTHRLVAEWNGRLVGALSATTVTRRGTHRLRFWIHPDHTITLSSPLVNQALDLLLAAPSMPASVTVGKAQLPLLHALHKAGFQEQRTLLTLRKDFA
jgi:ribosomal protein S18 acetylase RimI-like enzyme